jgi:hypothetical protein
VHLPTRFASQLLAQLAVGFSAVRHDAHGNVDGQTSLGQNGPGAAPNGFVGQDMTILVRRVQGDKQVSVTAATEIVAARGNMNIAAAKDMAIREEFAQTYVVTVSRFLHFLGLLALDAVRCDAGMGWERRGNSFHQESFPRRKSRSASSLVTMGRSLQKGFFWILAKLSR